MKDKIYLAYLFRQLRDIMPMEELTKFKRIIKEMSEGQDTPDESELGHTWPEVMIPGDYIIPHVEDTIQIARGIKRTPEIRVWVHTNESDSDYYTTFRTFHEAEDYCKKQPNAERYPVIAFCGLEVNLYALLYTLVEGEKK